jgi:Uncharacterized protein conserved in bacteria (DUF2188)
MPSDIHVIPSGDGGWAIRREGSVRASAIYPTQEIAVKEARSYARQERTDVFVHGRDGRIQSARSFGNEPIHLKG